MMRNIVAGNWKSNKSINESREWMSEMSNLEGSMPKDVRVIVAPPAPYLAALAEVKPSNVILASQTVSATGSGAYTGEFTADMLTSCGVEFALIGHSERRGGYGETDEVVVDKISRCIEAGLGVVLCCGEPLEVRDSGGHEEMIARQLDSAMNNLSDVDPSKFVIAYEPIWAIGTGRTATSEQAGEMHTFIRSWLSDKFSQERANQISILYGGSCKPSNADELFANANVDGGLIGGASLKTEDFSQIIKAASK
ncbi:MAG: triose-phosphate isomerase [Crocinitomicaceae bacterium]|nr:triose-phosphate isomerase [Crocinitomicaceae bacterium]